MLEAAVAALVLTAVPQDHDFEDRARFITFAIFEGLWEDGVDPELARGLSKQDDPIYVYKCPICMPVAHGFQILSAAPPPMYGSQGNAFPADIAAQLKAVDLPTRKKGLEALVKRYVERRFERLNLSEAESKRMRKLLEEGRASGATMKEKKDTTCPSCDGAAKAGK